MGEIPSKVPNPQKQPSAPSELPDLVLVPEPPKRPHAAFRSDLPRLVKRREVEHLDAFRSRPFLRVDEVLQRVFVPGFRRTQRLTLTRPARLGDDDLLVRLRLLHLVVHLLHVEQRIVNVAAFPVGVAIGQNHVARLRQLRPIRKLIIRIHVPDRDVRQRVPHPMDARDQFLFRHLFAVQHLVAHGRHVDDPGLRQLDEPCHFLLVLVLLFPEPRADQGLEPVLTRQLRNHVVAVRARENPDPLGVRLKQRELATDLGFGERVPGLLVSRVGAEAKAVHLGLHQRRTLLLEFAAIESCGAVSGQRQDLVLAVGHVHQFHGQDGLASSARFLMSSSLISAARSSVMS